MVQGDYTSYYTGIPIKGWMISQGENMQPKSTIAL